MAFNGRQCREVPREEKHLERLFADANANFDSFISTELAVIYAGLSCLTEQKGTDLDRLAKRVEDKYGFRLK